MLADGKDLNVLFVFREEQPLRRSEDAGDTWADIALPTGASWPHGAATCKSPHSCLYVLYTQGERQTIARSDDHGQSWAELNVLPPSMLPSAPKAMLVAYDSTGHLFIPAGGRELAESRDGGRSWISLTTPETTAISELAILPDGTLLLAGSMGLPPGAQFRSTDSGNTWQRMAEGGAEFFVSYSRPTTVFASNWDGLRRSDDSGETWTAISPPGLRLAQGMAEVAEGKFVVPVSGFGLVAFE